MITFNPTPPDPETRFNIGCGLAVIALAVFWTIIYLACRLIW